MILMAAAGVATLYVGANAYLKRKTLIKEKMALLSGKKRQGQMQEISGSKEEISEEEKELNRVFAVGSANLGIAAASLVFSPLVWAMIPGLLYCYVPLYKLAYDAMKERRITSYVVDVILVTGMFAGGLLSSATLGFFAAAALGVWFFVGGRKLLLKSEHNTKKGLSNLFEEQPRSVWVIIDGAEIEIPFEKLQVDDVIIASAGQRIPVDGVITSGSALIDQHTLTGEAKPIEKGHGDEVLASTIVLSGRVHVETKKTGSQTVAMQIGKVLNETADFKSLMQSRGEAIADKTVLPTLGVSALALPFFGFSAALAVLTNTFGYKMRVFAPASMLNFLSYSSQQGILIKDGRSLELLREVDTVVFDKTGTLTLEEPTVGNIHLCADVSENDILKYAAAAEHGQTHPVAKAILTAANQRDLQWPTLDDAKYDMGYGIKVNLSGQIIRVGSERFMTLEGIDIPTEINAVKETCHEEGHSFIMVAFDDQLVGIIELHATLRPEAKQVVKSLQQRNMSVYIISGDHEQPTKKLAEALGVDHYFAGTLPEHKASLVAKLQEEGKSVCFVGDGINDSIALKKANVSVSLSGATTIAMDTAQIVLMDGTLNQLDQLFNISKDFELNMRNNLLISTLPTVVGIGGIVFFHWGVFIAHVWMGGTLAIGIANTMLPLLKSENKKNLKVAEIQKIKETQE